MPLAPDSVPEATPRDRPTDAAAIQPWPDNPRYWQLDGRPILALGASDEDNPFQWPAGRLVAQLDDLAAVGGNVLRNTMSDRDPGNLRAFRGVEPGRYDLTQPNPEYWQRFRFMLEQTARRRIVVQLELWDRFDHSQQFWRTNPYRPANNINYTAASSGLADDYPNHPGANEQPFFFTPPALHDNRVLLRFQQDFIRRVLDHTLPFGHVLYCIDNETDADEAWPTYWAGFVRDYARPHPHPCTHPRRVCLTEMWDDWDVRTETHQRTIARPDRYDYIDLSQNNHTHGDTHWDHAQTVYRQIAAQPRPINSTKIYGSTEIAPRWPGQTKREALHHFWRNLLGGFATSRFHRPPAGLGLCDLTRSQLAAARQWQHRYDPFRSTPDHRHHYLVDRVPDSAYLATHRNGSATVLTPNGQPFTLRREAAPDATSVAWLDLLDPAWTYQTLPPVPLSDPIRLAPPGPGRPWIAVLTREALGNTTPC